MADSSALDRSSVLKALYSTFGGSAYQQALDKLEKDYEASFGYKKQREIFEEFTRKYTTIPEIWLKWFELESDYNRKQNVDSLRKQALTHFYSLDFIGFLRPDTTCVKEFSKLIEWPYLDVLRYKCYHMDPTILAEGLQLAEKALAFPHLKLEEVYKIYSSKKEVPEDVKINYRYSKFLMHLLKNANSDAKWCTFLRMARNVDFITQNMEYKIGKNPWNVRLWRLYIGYLKDINSPNVLSVYSRFCRFFVDDKDVLAEYRNEIQQMQRSGKRVAKWWMDTLEFERDFGTSLSAQLLFKKAFSCSSYDPELAEYAKNNGMKYGYDSDTIEFMLSKQTEEPSPSSSTALIAEKENIQMEAKEEDEREEDFADLSTFYKPWGQRFSIPNAVIFHMLKTSNYQMLSKLFATCKLLFSKFKVILCHELFIRSSDIQGTSPSGSSMQLGLTEVVNFYVTRGLTVIDDTNSNLMVWLREALYQCDAEMLNLGWQNIPLNIFEYFIEKATNITVQNCNITNENGQILNIQDIIALFPNADRMKFVGNTFTPQSAEALAEMDKPVKIKAFSLHGVPPSFNAAHFATFIRKNAAPSAVFSLFFTPEVPDMMKQEFLFAVRNEIMQIADSPPRFTVN